MSATTPSFSFQSLTEFSGLSRLRQLQQWYRSLRVLLVLMLSFVLGSCSTARLAYSNADTLVYWWMDGYVEFNSAQKTKVKRDIGQWLSWHRSSQLPQYAQTLTQMQTMLAANPGQAEIDGVFRQIEQHVEVALLKVVPELTDFVLSMDDSQKAHLVRKFEKNNEDFRDKYLDLTPEKQAKERRKKILKQVDEWLGSVTREQEALIALHLEKHPANYTQWLEESMARQRLVMQLITHIQTEKPSRETAQAMVQKLIMTSFETANSAERRSQTETSRMAMQTMLPNLLRLATPAQKAHATQKLQNWIDDCKYLSAKK